MTVTPTLANRKTIRASLASTISSALTGSGAAVSTVLAYPKKNVQGNTPLICLESSGSMRATANGTILPRSGFYLNIHIFVPYIDDDSSWTEEDSENRLDDIEADVVGLIDLYGDQRGVEGALWETIEILDRSRIDMFIEGQEFRHEVIPLAVTAYNTG